MNRYISFAKSLGADSVRFAELKGDGGDFVDLVSILGDIHDLSEDPFSCGCSVDVTMQGLPVNLRIMCGLQTPHRRPPIDPEQTLHDVLYYDGNLYQGWQREEIDMDSKAEQAVVEVLGKLDNALITFEEAKAEIVRIFDEFESPPSKKKSGTVGYSTGAGCVY